MTEYVPCRCSVIVDAFAGVGGNAIQFAMTCDRVIAVELCQHRLELARHNAQVYGVAHKIDFICGDFLKVAATLEVLTHCFELLLLQCCEAPDACMLASNCCSVCMMHKHLFGGHTILAGHCNKGIAAIAQKYSEITYQAAAAAAATSGWSKQAACLHSIHKHVPQQYCACGSCNSNPDAILDSHGLSRYSGCTAP